MQIHNATATALVLLITAGFTTSLFARDDTASKYVLENDPEYPWLDTLEVGDWLDTLKATRQTGKIGRRLHRIEPGLHNLEREDETQRHLFIGVHGFASRGYEWLYPLNMMDAPDTTTYFFKWVWLNGVTPFRPLFLSELNRVVENATEPVEKITIVAHSCGGVLVASVMEEFPRDIEYEIHVVAAPLAGMGLFTVCKPTVPSAVPDGISFTQWRTVQSLDSAFFYFMNDPQIVDIHNSEVVQLPPSYRGKRLGHVRALSWVVEQLQDTDDSRVSAVDAAAPVLEEASVPQAVASY